MFFFKYLIYCLSRRWSCDKRRRVLMGRRYWKLLV